MVRATMNVARILSVAVALPLAFVAWGIALEILLRGVYSRGRIGWREELVFLLPAALCMAPLAIRLLLRGHLGRPAWLVALAPVAGAVSMALYLYTLDLAHARWPLLPLRADAMALSGSCVAWFAVAIVVWRLTKEAPATKSTAKQATAKQSGTEIAA